MKAKVLSATATALMLLLAAAALPLTLPKLMGYKIYTVLTPSMAPALPVGSAIYVQGCDPAALQAGDIVTFTLGRGDLVETHRVVENARQAQQLTTQGDANARPDVYPVAYNRVVGRVAFSIPALGAASMALHTGGGIAVCTAIFVLAFILWTLADKMKKRESFK